MRGPGPFGLVHRHVGPLEQLLELVGVLGVHGHADGHLEFEVDPVQREGLGERARRAAGRIPVSASTSPISGSSTANSSPPSRARMSCG